MIERSNMSEGAMTRFPKLIKENAGATGLALM
jgi:hypothetical protein